MHELAVTESILEIAQRHAQEARAAKVTDIHIMLGQLASIVDDSVQFYWDFISENTICADSKLHFKRIPAQLTCQDCGNTYTIPEQLSPCPVCHSVNIKVVTGEEFWVDSIEIELKE